MSNSRFIGLLLNAALRGGNGELLDESASGQLNETHASVVQSVVH